MGGGWGGGEVHRKDGRKWGEGEGKRVGRGERERQGEGVKGMAGEKERDIREIKRRNLIKKVRMRNGRGERRTRYCQVPIEVADKPKILTKLKI